ncbi:MAG: hypothetical protein U0441_37510 [Polyangiaceae bacterium]
MDPLPKVQEIAALLKDLLGRNVNAKESKTPLATGAGFKGVVTELVNADGATAAVLVVDLPFASHSGAAMTMLAPGASADSIKAGILTDVLLENYAEVANVMTALYRPYGKRMIRGRVFANGEKVIPPIAAFMVGHKQHIYADIEVTGYGAGRIALLQN